MIPAFKKIDRLLGVETGLISSLIMIVVTSIIFLFKSVGFSEILLLSKESSSSFLMCIFFLAPSILKLTAPMAILLGSFIMATRASLDREIEAWMSCGVSVFRLLNSFFVLGCVTAALALFTSLYFEPYARQEWTKFKWVQARHGVEAIMESRLREKTFISKLFHSSDNDISFYVDHLSDSKKQFFKVFLMAQSNKEKYPLVLFAEQGTLTQEDNQGVVDYMFTLAKGSYYQFDEKLQTWNFMHFKSLKFSLISMFQKQFDPDKSSSDSLRSLYPFEYINELKKLRQDPDWSKSQKIVRQHSFFYEQFLIPLSCLALPIIGFCLGIQDVRRKNILSYTVLAFIIFIFYAFIMLAQQFSLKFYSSPEISLWLPGGFLIIIVGILLRWRVKYPFTVKFFEFIRLEFGR